MQKVIGIIPARFGSTRFPGKPLAKILDKSLIQRTYENARLATHLSDVIVATDDRRIFDHVLGFGGKAAMTSNNCATGTDRLAEVIKNDPSLHDVDIIVNIQGDEPTLDPHIIESVALALEEDPQATVSTAIVRLKFEEQAFNPHVVKCVIDRHGYALYFSRALIPAGKSLSYVPGTTYYKHLGIYGYRREFLLHYSELQSTPLQLAEDLEQLKVLENGFRIKTVIVESECMDVNTPEDIKKVEQLIWKQNTSS